MTPQQFEIISEMIRARKQSNTYRAARDVLLGGKTIKEVVEAAAARGANERISQQSVARSVRRYRDLHIALKAAYGARGEPPE